MRSHWLIGLSLLLGCGGAAQGQRGGGADPEMFESRTEAFAAPKKQGHVARAQRMRAPRVAALTFTLQGRAFGMPLVHGTVAGVPTWMLIDTGANSHVITTWLAKRARLEMSELGAVGTDHTGRAVKTYRVDAPNVRIDRWGALAAGPMLVTDVPDAIEQLGIGAFISPQWLGENDEAIVVDFAAGQLSSAGFDDAVSAIRTRGKSLAPAGGKLCEDSGSSIGGLSFVVPAIVDGRAVQLLVDTGARRTDFLSSTLIGQSLAARSFPSREQMYAASGLVRTRVVKGVRVNVGEWGIVTDVELVPGIADPTCPRDGVVSMDVLKSCVLVLGRKQFVGRCGA